MDNVFVPFDRDAEIQTTRRNLPHWEQPSVTYFVTFRTADSIPAFSLAALRTERSFFHKTHPKPWNPVTRQIYRRRFIGQIDRLLDKGHGSCPFRRSTLAQEMSHTLHFGDGERYTLDRYIVMPNHCYVLFKPGPNSSLKTVVQSWESYSAQQVNRLLRRRGSLWQTESFDHAVRSWLQLERHRLYIATNPVKAGLSSGEFLLGHGSGLVAG